jgi:hypothetical protein
LGVGTIVGERFKGEMQDKRPLVPVNPGGGVKASRFE